MVTKMDRIMDQTDIRIIQVYNRTRRRRNNTRTKRLVSFLDNTTQYDSRPIPVRTMREPKSSLGVMTVPGNTKH
jgi:hypothetical protein